MKIYLVRHTSVDVPKGYAYGHTDVGLRDTFEEEATAVKAQLSGLQFDKVWTSPLSRCVRLAAFCGYPNAEREDRIKELYFGDWEMRPWDELQSDPLAARWFGDWVNTATPNGESLMDQYHRVSAFLDEIRRGGWNNVCLFTHGGVLTCVRVYAGEYKIEKAFDRIPSYGEIVCIHFKD